MPRGPLFKQDKQNKAEFDVRVYTEAADVTTALGRSLANPQIDPWGLLAVVPPAS